MIHPPIYSLHVQNARRRDHKAQTIKNATISCTKQALPSWTAVVVVFVAIGGTRVLNTQIIHKIHKRTDRTANVQETPSVSCALLYV